MKVTTLASNFTAGELSPRLDGRVDITKFKNGLRECENFTILPHGGARKRPGTKYVVAQKSTSDDVRLVPFIYNSEQAYVLVFGPSYIWFMKDQGIVTHDSVSIAGITKASPAAVTTSGAHSLTTGDRVIVTGVAGMTEVNNRQFTVTVTGATTFTLDGVNSSSYGTYTSGGSMAKIVELTTTYTADQLDELQFSQTNDTLYVVHGSHPIRTISRTSHTSWTLATPSITTGPFRTVDTSDTRMTFSAPTATITGATQANPCVLTVTSHTFNVGETITISSVIGMTNLNGNSYVISAASATQLTLVVDSTGFTPYTSGGIAEVSTTAYGTYQVGNNLTMTASSAYFDADMVGTLFRFWEDGGGSGLPAPPIGENKVIVVGMTYTHAGNAYGVKSSTAPGAFAWSGINRVPDHTSGVVRVYNSNGDGNYYEAAFLHRLYCIIRVTEYVSATSVKVQIVRYQMPKNVVDGGTTYWSEGAWSTHRGYPKSIAWYEQRLFFGGSDSEPTALWSSKSGAYLDFTDGADDDDAIVYRLASGRADVIRWLHSGRVLTCGTSAGEFAVAASNQNEALTPSNFKITPQTSFGTSEAQPIRVHHTVLYPQRSGRITNAAKKLREFAYSFSDDAFNSTDLTVFSEHIMGDGFDQIAFQMEPDSIIWCRRTDGTLAACTYERTQEVVAWHRHEIGGGGSVRSICTIPGANGEEVWLSVVRTIASGTVRYIEVLQHAFSDRGTKADAFFVDSGLTYSGASTTTVTGLWHLRGETVDVLSNGNVERAAVSALGAVTLSRATTKAHFGYAYTGTLETEDFEAGAQGGTAQSRQKRISSVNVRLLNSLGGSVGPDASNMQTIYYRTGADVHGSSVALYSGFQPVDMKSGWENSARVRIEHSDPLPFHVTGIVAELNVSG